MDNESIKSVLFIKIISMKSAFFLLFITMFLCGNTNAQTGSAAVPEGVVYKTCADSDNLKAEKILRKELSDSCSFSMYNQLLFVGPKLWLRYKDVPGVGDIPAGNLTCKVPVFNEKGKKKGTQDLTGKLIQSQEDFNVFWKQVLKDFKGADITVRKLRGDEMAYYWAIIFFDIEEPVFALECASYTFLFDMNKNGQLEWIEQLN
jgi:hypothetical protein